VRKRLEDAFPSLFDLSLAANLTDMSCFFQGDFAPLNLTDLYIHTTRLESAGSVHNILLILSESCHMLRFLGLDMCSKWTQSPLRAEDGSVEDNITLAILEPLLAFSQLAHLWLTYHRRLQLTNADLQSLLSRWPTIEKLTLNPEPMLLDEPSCLTLDVLPVIAKHCPSMRELQLYLDCSGAALLQDPLGHAFNFLFTTGGRAHPFQHLTFFSPGMSPLRACDAAPTAMYLSKLFPSHCDIAAGATWVGQVDASVEFLGAIHALQETWGRVRELTPLLVISREEERKRARQLEKELEDVRARLSIFEDQRLAAAGNVKSMMELPFFLL